MPTRLSHLAGLLLAAVVLAGCSAEQMRTLAIRPAPLPVNAAPGNRLVVQGMDGNIFTIAPDGSERVQVTDDAGRRRQYQQPTWSPDGARLAIARVDYTGSGIVGALLLKGWDGAQQTEVPLPFAPFYIYWSPLGNQIAYLSNWQGLEGPSMALRLFDIATKTSDTVAEATPYYFSWSPSGGELVAHVSDLRLELQDSAGGRRTLLDTGGGFAAPQWSADGRSLLFGVSDEEGKRLVLSDESGASLREITPFDERISFLANRQANQVAWVPSPFSATANTLGPLYVTDVDSGRTRQLSELPVWAFLWSPDGAKLAFLQTDADGREFWLRWAVWDGSRVTRFERFLPTRLFLERYMVYSDQYAQSMRLWSPDGTAIVYPGTSESGRRGIWVQEASGGPARWVSGGVMASWSPQ